MGCCALGYLTQHSASPTKIYIADVWRLCTISTNNSKQDSNKLKTITLNTFIDCTFYHADFLCKVSSLLPSIHGFNPSWIKNIIWEMCLYEPCADIFILSLLPKWHTCDRSFYGRFQLYHSVKVTLFHENLISNFEFCPYSWQSICWNTLHHSLSQCWTMAPSHNYQPATQ